MDHNTNGGYSQADQGDPVGATVVPQGGHGTTRYGGAGDNLGYYFAANLALWLAAMDGPAAPALSRVREENFALGDAVLRAEAARPERSVRWRAPRAVKEVAARTGIRVTEVRECRLLAAAFPPGHEARTHPRMPPGLLRGLARLTATDCEYWYPRVAAGEAPLELFFALVDSPAEYR
jgi:hypothetical protein